MDEMFDAIRLELETNFDDPPTPEVQKFFDMLRALEESLHEHTALIILAFVTCLMTIKSMFTFSNKCYMELLHLISDVLPNNHKKPKHLYQSKKICLLLVWSTRRLMRIKITACFSTKSTRMRQNA
jgi:Sec-independent protein secretion pathway component TatC